MSQVRKCPGKEGFQRLNYLYQAANLLATDNETHHIASCFYSNLMVNISKKTVLRLDIPIKRSICKLCRTLLLAGVTCRVRIKKKKVVWTCIKCRTAKVFPTENGEHLTWTQKPESVVEILDYTPKEDIKQDADNQDLKVNETAQSN